MIPFQLPYTLKYAGNYTNIKISEHGIADERGFYFQHLGMLPVLIKHKGNYTTFPWVSLGYQAQDKNNINIFCAIGMTGWASGSKPYWVDPYALAEPFLARLPAKLDSRTGHYERAFPSGYFKTLISKESHFANETIARLYKDIRLTVAGDIWTKKRWEAIYRLNTGHYQHLEKHFDRNATGLMELGFAVHDRGSRSCAGFKNLHKFISIPPTNNK